MPKHLRLQLTGYFIMFCLIVLFILSSYAQDSTLIIKGDQAYLPFEFLNDKGEADGFTIDVAKAICRRMDLDVHIELGPWNEVRKELESGEIDAVTGMYQTISRDSFVDFTKPLFLSSYTIFVRKDSDIKGLEDIDDKVILVQNADVGHDFVIENGYGKLVLIESDWQKVLLSLSKGTADCALVSRLQGYMFLENEQITNLKAVGKPFLQRKFCMAVKEGDSELQGKLNEGLALIKATGEYDEIYQKWFGKFDNNKASLSEILRTTGWIFGILLFIVLSIFIWSIVLNRKVHNRTEQYMQELTERIRIEKRLRFVADITTDLIYEWDINTNELKWYGDIDKTLGYEPGEVKHTLEAWLEIIHPEDLKKLENAVEKHKISTDIIQEEYRIQRKDGSWRYWVDEAKPILDHNNMPSIWIGGCKDVTEAVIAQEALKQNEYFLRTVINATPDIICFKGPNGEWLISNEANAELFNLSDVDYNGKTDLELAELSDDEFSNVLKYCHITDEETWEKGKLSKSEENIVLLDGTNITYDLVKVPIFNDDGSRRGIVILGRDITERKLSEIALRESEENLYTTINSIGDAVIATNSLGKIERINPVALELLGVTPAEALGKEISEIVDLRDFDTDEPIENFIESIVSNKNESRITKKLRFKSNDERKLVVNFGGSTILNIDGQVIGAVLIFRDITKEQMLQEQLQHSRKMDAIGQLAGGIAHDFNNMLAGIVGATEMLSIELRNRQQCKTYLDMIFNSSERATALTTKLLAFSRKGKQQASPVDLHNSINNVILLLERTINRNILIQSSLDAESYTIIGDPSSIENSILSIGINARDAMPNGGHLTIKTKNEYLDDTWCKSSGFDILPGHYIDIEISDDGIGISSDYRNKIFEPFFTTKEKSKGTGLGLASVYGTIKSHDGAISVYSVVKKGTVFHLYLPIKNEPSQHPTPVSDITIYGYGNILVIDDEQLIRETAEALLLELGYDVFIAPDGEKGIEVYKNNQENIDVVLLDMIMPGINGIETFKRLKAINPDVKVVLSSGFTREEETEELIENGLSAFIRKPYRRAVLSSIIHNIINK